MVASGYLGIGMVLPDISTFDIRARGAVTPCVSQHAVKEALKQAGVVPSKRLGQNFLCDPNAARWIVDQLEPAAEDFVVEVGPALAP